MGGDEQRSAAVCARNQRPGICFRAHLIRYQNIRRQRPQQQLQRLIFRTAFQHVCARPHVALRDPSNASGQLRPFIGDADPLGKAPLARRKHTGQVPQKRGFSAAWRRKDHG